jgi:hypothetical protein
VIACRAVNARWGIAGGRRTLEWPNSLFGAAEQSRPAPAREQAVPHERNALQAGLRGLLHENPLGILASALFSTESRWPPFGNDA